MEKIDLLYRTEREEMLERLVVIDEPESLRLVDRISGTLELDDVEAYVEIRTSGERLMRIYAECAGMTIDGPYGPMMTLLGNPFRSRVSDTARALAVRVMELMVGPERMDRTAAAIRVYTVKGGVFDQHYRHLSDALAASGALFDASLECSQGCMLDVYQTDLLRLGWRALGAGEDCDIRAGISEGRFEYHLMCRIMPELDDIMRFVEGVC